MKKYILALLTFAAFSPLTAYATPVSWDLANGVLQPLQSAWTAQIKGSYFTSTSTSAVNTFPNLRATNATTTNATTTGSFYHTGITASKILQVDGNGKVIPLTVGSGLSFDGTTLSTSGSGITALGPAGQLQTGGSQTFATSSDTNIGLTITSSGDTHTFTSNWIGTLADSRVSDTLTVGASGSVADGALSANVSLLGQTIGVAELASADFGSFTCNGSACTVDNGAISNAMLANSTISGIALGSNLADLTATNSTLTFSGSYNGGTARTIGLNLGNANTWTALQQFSNASTTMFSSYGPSYFGATATSSFSSAGVLTLATDLAVSEGGTGVSTITGVVKGNGTSAFTAGVDGTDFTLVNAVSCTNQVMTALTAAGVGTCSSINNAFWSGTDLSVANGGTGLSTFGGVDTILFTSAAGTLTSDSLFTYNAARDALGVGTSTPRGAAIVAATSTGPQLMLSDTSATTDHWTFRNISNSLFISTSSPSTLATSTTAAITISNNANFGIGSTTPTSRLSVVGDALISGITRAARFIITGISASFTPSVEGEFGIDTTSNQFKFFSGGATRVLSPVDSFSFSYATSTTMTGTTTLLMAPAPTAITVGSAYCETDTGTMGMSLYDGTNRATYMATASTTKNLFTFSANNSFTAGESIRVDIGNPASSPTKIACRFRYTYDAD